MTSEKTSQLGERLLQRGRSPNAENPVAILPINEMPMVLTLDQLRPNPDNPRTSRNPKYEDIKASIRVRGLDSVPKVTKDPESAEDVYIFSDGGNTRYTILTELFAETSDERFRRVQCMVKPWPGRLQCVIGHLAENDVRGDLSFIEKAFGIEKARSIYQEQLGRSVSQRELADLLRSEGYPIHHSNISRMTYTIEHLYPCLPELLNSGIGRPQITQLIALRTAAEKAWQTFSQQTSLSLDVSFEDVFGRVCRAFDDPDIYSHDVFKDELIAALLKALPDPQITYDSWLIELDPQEQNRRKLFGSPESVPQHVRDADVVNEDEPLSQDEAAALPPVATSPSKRTAVAAELDKLEESLRQPDEDQLDLYGDVPASSLIGVFPVNTPVIDEETAEGLDEDIGASDAEAVPSIPFSANGLEPVTDIWFIPALQDDVEHLQDMAFRLAFELAEEMGIEGAIQEDKSLLGAGFNLQELSPGALADSGGELLIALGGGKKTHASLSSLADFMIGTSGPFDDPRFDDVSTVKFLRLFRVLRRLRELQRLTFREEKA